MEKPSTFMVLECVKRATTKWGVDFFWVICWVLKKIIGILLNRIFFTRAYKEQRPRI